MSSWQSARTSLVFRSLRFWTRHLVLLQVVLFALVWILYGVLELRGHGRDYLARASDFWLERGPGRFASSPGIENILVPAATAGIAKVSNSVGVEFTDRMFVLLTIAPYPLFIYGVTHLVHRVRMSGALALAAAVALYTSGMIPYMASWGGYVDGVSYLLLLPVLLRPESLAVYSVTFVLQCLNHYLGALSLLMLAFVWHSMKALEAPDGRKYWLGTVVPKALVSVVVLAGFLWFWQSQYPEASRARQAIAAAKWSDPAGVVQEVAGPFPWTLLSTLKLAIVPIVALMLAPFPHRRLRALTLAIPFAVAAALTFVFVDVTRVATMLVLPALLVTVHVATSEKMPAAARRRLRRLIVAMALANLLIPNYYVNNGEVLVPPSQVIRGLIASVAGP